MEYDFPIATFPEIKRNLSAERNHLEKEKAAWRTVRNSHTLLQYAMTSRGVVENTVQLLRQAGLVEGK